MSDPSDIDPRYDPAFQRGYEGEIATQRRRTGLHVPRAVPADQASAAGPGVVPSVPGASVPYSAAPYATASYTTVPQGTAPARTAPPATPSADAATSAPPAPAVVVGAAPRLRLVSGWTITIAVIAVVLILGGGFVVNGFLEGELSDGGSGQSLYVVLFGMFAAPLAIGIGVLALLGLLFLGAVQSRRRPVVEEDDSELTE